MNLVLNQSCLITWFLLFIVEVDLKHDVGIEGFTAHRQTGFLDPTKVFNIWCLT